MKRKGRRLWALLMSLCLTLSLLPATALAADTYSVTLHYDESLCTVTANKLVAGENGMSDPSKTTVIVTGNGQTAWAPAGTWLQFQIDDIAEGYRIGSVTVNGTDRTEGFVNGAYGGMAFSNMSRDYELTAVMEPIPDPLPSVTGVTLYLDEDGTNLAPDSITFTADNADDKLFGKATFSDGLAHPTYYAMGQWQFSTDGITWQDTVTWGDNRFDFLPGWSYHEELDFLNASYDLRLKVTPWDIYTTGAPVYSNVIHINGGAGGSSAADLAVSGVNIVSTGRYHLLSFSLPSGVTQADFAQAHLKVEVYDQGQAQWELWDSGMMLFTDHDGYVLEDLLESSPMEGAFNQIRVTTISNLTNEVLGVYEGPIALTVRRETDTSLPVKAVFAEQEDGSYLVTTSGLTVGQMYSVPVMGQDGNQLLSSVGIVTATDTTMTDTAELIIGNNADMASAVYHVYQFAAEETDPLTITVIDRSGEKACFPPCDHNWSKWEVTKEATCTEDGERTATCDKCQETKTEVIPATGHTEVIDEAVAATCTTAGKTEGKHCSACNEVLVEQVTIPATGHTSTETDCTKQDICSVCHEVIREAGAHTWGNWTVTEEATCTEGGSRTRSCTSCGHQETETIPALGHNWGEWVVTKEPTETEDGAQTRTCSCCSAEETQRIAKLEKQELSWIINDSTITWTYGEVEHVQNTANNDTEGGGALTYSSSDPAVATVDEDGKATIVGAGTATITATAAAVPGKYVETSASYTLTIHKAPLTITANNAAISYGQAPAGTGWTGSGYVYQEDASVVTGTPAYTSTYEQYGAVGTYALTVSGLSAKNYQITYAPGTLTVSEAADYTITLGKLEQLAGHTSPVSAQISPYDATAKITVEYLVGDAWTETVPADADSYQVRAALTSSDNITPKEDTYTTGTLTIGSDSTVSVGNTTVSVGTTVAEDGKAEITVSDEQLNEILTHADGNVSMDLSGVKDTDQLVLPGSLISGLSKSETAGSLTVATEDASVVLSGSVLDTVASAVTGDGDQIAVQLAAVEDTDLSEKQQAALESISQEAVIVEVSLVITHEDQSTTQLHQLGGDVEVKVPYAGAVPAGKYVVVCYLSDDGNVTYLRAAYDAETRQISFTTNHFSNYAVFVSDKPAVVVNGGSGSGTYAVNETVTIQADSKSGYRFDHWDVVSNNVTLTNANSSKTTFIMPAGNVEITAIYDKVSSGGGGGGAAAYSITAESAENGSVTLSPKSASKGDTVTITVQPDPGYVLETLTVLDKAGQALQVTLRDGKYTFTMPASAVTVRAVFVPMHFADVAQDDYYYDAVRWAVTHGITSGTGADTFRPDSSCTRAQMVTFLWRAAGSPAPQSASSPFTDVSSDAYYCDAVLWAVENGITSGTSATTFSPDATVTRAQGVTFLWRQAGSPASDYTMGFADVEGGAYYAEAVRWAAGEGVTAGTGAAAFSPESACTRAQIVTFLYRALAE